MLFYTLFLLLTLFWCYVTYNITHSFIETKKKERHIYIYVQGLRLITDKFIIQYMDQPLIYTILKYKYFNSCNKI